MYEFPVCNLLNEYLVSVIIIKQKRKKKRINVVFVLEAQYKYNKQLKTKCFI